MGISKCECCGGFSETKIDKDTRQELCDSCYREEDTVYCFGCETLRHNGNLDWLNDCALCDSCMGIINL